ncbi:MerR family transcriptional regulator [Aurantiacibacter hainanensis]|uniref:MerR family transcriptional regulator n=1 Tax=Aurantiacibacter hainanensis TaxID=3076114 RepID=UPI0030C73315
MDPTSSLYSRQQIGQLVGLDDTTLNYWSRERLLIPTEGGEGRGSHRRFDFIQVNIAAILAQLRPFGLNIAVLRPLADLLQRAADLGKGGELHPGDYFLAARLATKLHQFRSGSTVMVRQRKHAEERPSGLSRQAYIDWLMAERPATTEAEITDELLQNNTDYSTAEAIIAVADAMGPNRETEARLYGDLVFGVLAPGYSDEYSWLLGFRSDQSWRIEFGHQGGKFFDGLGSTSPEEFGAGIFLPVSAIIRQVWDLKTWAEIHRDREAERRTASRDRDTQSQEPKG